MVVSLDFKVCIFLSLILVPEFLFAQNSLRPGQVIKIQNDKVYIQNLGLDHSLEKDEFVRIITNSKNRINIKIESVDPEIAIGNVDSVYIPPFAPVDKLTPGQVIQLGLPIEKSKSMSFFGGANFSPSKNGFGGHQYFLGINIHAPIQDSDIRWYLGLQADSLGKKDGIEVRKGSYLLGLGKMYLKTWMFFAVGVIDTMVINEAVRDAGGTTTNPFTGASIPNEGVNHNDQAGFQFIFQRPFLIKEMSRNQSFGFSTSPYLTYAQTFSSSDYGSTTSFGLSFDFLIE